MVVVIQQWMKDLAYEIEQIKIYFIGWERTERTRAEISGKLSWVFRRYGLEHIQFALRYWEENTFEIIGLTYRDDLVLVAIALIIHQRKTNININLEFDETDLA